MKTNIKSLAVCVMLGAAASLSAQNTNSGYFLDGYNYRYQMNPAFGNDMNFVSIPVVGNINFAVRGNLHLTDVFHVVDGKTVLFTNPEVSPSFLKDIKDFNKLNTDLSINILSGGFKAWGGYNTVSINARADIYAGLPKSLFVLAKDGITNDTYQLGGIGAKGNAYAEIAFNHSHDIKSAPGLRIGGAVKFLVGLASIEAKTRKADLILGQDQWTAITNATLNANFSRLHYKTKRNDLGQEYVSGVEMDDSEAIKPNGFGMAFDLGLNYKFRDFNFSAAVLDLGWITYSNTVQASTNGNRTFNTDAYVFNANEDAPNSFKHEWDRFTDDLGDLYQLTDNGNVGSRTVMPTVGLNFGVDYALPVYRRLHFGLLSSTRFVPNYTWTELRVSANVNPVNCFSATANFAVSNYGCAFGWLLNFNHRWFNIFVGMDHTTFKLAKEGVPLNSNASVNFGMNIPF